jgi:hypothetical protein
MEMRGYHPLDDIKEDLQEAWGNPTLKRLIQFPLYYKIGRNPTSENKSQKHRWRWDDCSQEDRSVTDSKDYN